MVARMGDYTVGASEAMSQQKAQTTQSLNLATRDIATAQQVNTLLGVASMMAATMQQFRHFDAMEEAEKPTRLTGEAAIAAQTTFIKACAQLDQILADNSRWDGEFHRKVEKAVEESHKANMEFFETQRKTSESLQKPHVQYRPSVKRLPDGMWCAYSGPIQTDAGKCIIGIGTCPEQALKNWDNAFSGTPDADSEAYLNEHMEEQQPPQEPPQNSDDTNAT